jgi:hypothetical protein
VAAHSGVVECCVTIAVLDIGFGSFGEQELGQLEADVAHHASQMKRSPHFACSLVYLWILGDYRQDDRYMTFYDC